MAFAAGRLLLSTASLFSHDITIYHRRPYWMHWISAAFCKAYHLQSSLELWRPERGIKKPAGLGPAGCATRP